MTKKDIFKNKVYGKTVAIMAHGKSIEELERRADEFKDYDITWVGFNMYHLMEDFIMSKMGRHLDFALDCVALHIDHTYSREQAMAYEAVRIPRFKRAMELGTTVMSTWNAMGTYYKVALGINFFAENEEKIILLDDLISCPTGANTLAVLIYALAAGQPKRIILFGADGYLKPEGVWDSYYMTEKQQEEKMLVHGNLHSGIMGNTVALEKTFDNLYRKYCRAGNVPLAEVINCSPDSVINLFKKVNYDEVKGYL
jgi:hypothetical protein